jgi:hypothetical protein
MRWKTLVRRSIFILSCFVLLFSSFNIEVSAQALLDPSPPDETVKLIFIHHSVGENWLADEQGGLGMALGENNYFVSDTYYGWGPDGIGDTTDTLDWPRWFTGPDSERYMQAVYNESDANAAGYRYYTRTLADPGGENQVIMFKSCFPNSDLGGNPHDAPAPGDDLTVETAKYTYNQLLAYFGQHPEKLFIVVTSPPMQHIDEPENMRAFANWLVEDWLAENDYPYNNVAVFDFFNVLTNPDNHHRYYDGEIEHITNQGGDELYYDWDGDDHPSPAGGRKATEEFIPLLNIWVNRWLADEPLPLPAPSSGGEVEPEAPSAPVGVLSGGLIDDFEGGPLPETDYWVAYRDEAVDTTAECFTTAEQAYQGDASLQIDFSVLSGSWASCELLFYNPNDWRGEGLQFYLQASEAGLPYGVLFYYQQGEDWGTSVVEFESLSESVDGWARINIPWEEFAVQDSLVYPEVGLGMAFVFAEGPGGGTNTGTIWIDELGIYTTESEQPAAEAPETAPPSSQEELPDDGNQDSGGGLPFCGSMPLTVLLVGFGFVGLRRRDWKR